MQICRASFGRHKVKKISPSAWDFDPSLSMAPVLTRSFVPGQGVRADNRPQMGMSE